MEPQEIEVLDRRQGTLETKIAVIDVKLDNFHETLEAHIKTDELIAARMNKLIVALIILNGIIVIENIDKLAPFIKLFL